MTVAGNKDSINPFIIVSIVFVISFQLVLDFQVFRLQRKKEKLQADIERMTVEADSMGH